MVALGDSKSARHRAAERSAQKKDYLYALLVLLILIGGQVIWLLDLEFSEKVGLEGLVVAVAAVVFAIQHSNKLETVSTELDMVSHELDTVVHELQGVARSIPTRGIGVFPSYMPEVAELVGKAEKSIKVLCDTPAHGAFSNTLAFKEYWKNLQHKMVDGIKVECMFFDPAGRKQLHRAQIEADELNWGGWQDRNKKNCEAFDIFARQNSIRPPLDGEQPHEVWAGTPDAYVESMMAINEVVQSILEPKSSEFEELKFTEPRREGPTIYFWLRDKDQEAIFVIVPVRGIGVRDLAGFHTKEPELIRALGTVYEEAHKRVVPPVDSAQP